MYGYASIAEHDVGMSPKNMHFVSSRGSVQENRWRFETEAEQ